MFYRNGKLFYTQAGHTTLYWRWFSPDSSAVRALRNTIVSPITCTDSMSGNRNSELRIVVARPDASSDSIRPAMSIPYRHSKLDASSRLPLPL